MAQGQPKQVLRFTRIELTNWRNFRSADVRLARRAFFVGPNASGKSNMLAAIRFLRDIAISGGGFLSAVSRYGGMAQIRALHARRTPGAKLSVFIGTENEPEKWHYELHFKTDPHSHRPIIASEKVWSNEELILERPDTDDKNDNALLTQTHLEQISKNRNFRDISSFLSSVLYLHIVPQLIREPDRSVGKHDDPYGGDFLEKLAGASEKTRDSRLQKISNALKHAVPHFGALDMNQDDGGRWHLEVKYEHWRPQGAFQNETLFSDGTLRLMGLLWSLTEGRGPLLIEEPELSLNDRVIEKLPGIMAGMHRKTGRQVFITTHSAVLLNEPGIGLDEVHMLIPDREGTKIRTAADEGEIKALVETGGLEIGEAVMPSIAPKEVSRLKFDV